MHTRKDANHKEIVQALIEAHFTVIDLADVPANLPELAALPDILVGGFHQTMERHVNILMEIKTDDGKLRPGQRHFIDTCKGPVVAVRSAAEALAVMGIEIP